MALTTAFCENGNKATIPQTTTDGTVSYDQGFGSLYALPPEEGGKFIERAQFNQLMYDITSQALENKQALSSLSSSTYSKTEINNLLNTKANANATVNITGAQSIAGAKTFTSDITAPNITTMQNNLNTIFSSTTSPVKAQTSTKIITVGTSGNFTNLLSAIKEARKYTSNVTIRLVSDLEISENIQIDSLNGDHILIDFNNFKIKNNTSSLVSFIITASSIGRILNLNTENIRIAIGGCSKVTFGRDCNIQRSIETGEYSLFVLQNSRLSFSDNTSLVINAPGSNNVISAGTGAVINFSSGGIITSTADTGNLLSVYNAGIICIHNDCTINKPASLNFYNVAVNTPSGNGLILDKTNRV